MEAKAGTALDGVAVSFSDLTYSVPPRSKRDGPLVILDRISGCFMPGRLTALMGPSGSGKTTLMDILAGRKSGAGKIEGEILFGGAVVPKAALRHLCGYVEQFDTLVAELTVEQMLMYTAELKLPKAMGCTDKRQRVDEVISKLRLEKCRGTVIGSPLRRGISGGQAKRVNIALALITRPKACFLDEPTSGLDSKMANEVCMLLQELARDGCTVVATIHSPTSFAFSLFDDLTMFQGCGRVIFSGALAGARPYFEGHGCAFPEEQGYSLPDWLVETVSGAIEDEAEPAEHRDFAALWRQSAAQEAETEARVRTVAALKAAPMDAKALPTSGPGQLHALRTLLAYRMRGHYRSADFVGPRVADKLFTAFLTMTLYWGVGEKKDARSIMNTAATLYFFAALCGYGAAAFMPSLTLDRPLFYRERADGCYTAVTYYFSKFIEEAVICSLSSFFFTFIAYYSMSLQGSFLFFLLAYFLTAMTGIVLAYAIAAVAPNMEAANAMLPAYVTTCMYFGGLFLVFDKIPTAWQWYSYASFLRYAWSAMMLNQFQDSEVGQVRVFFDEETMTQQNVLQFYSMEDGLMSDLGACFGILAGICAVYGVLGMLGLTYISHVRR